MKPPDVAVSEHLIEARKALMEIEGWLGAMSLKGGRTQADVERAAEVAHELKFIAELVKP